MVASEKAAVKTDGKADEAAKISGKYEAIDKCYGLREAYFGPFDRVTVEAGEVTAKNLDWFKKHFRKGWTPAEDKADKKD